MLFVPAAMLQSLTPIWAGSNQKYMNAIPSEFAGMNSDITPGYDNDLPYYKADIPKGWPTSNAIPTPEHPLAYPCTYGHKWQIEH